MQYIIDIIVAALVSMVINLGFYIENRSLIQRAEARDEQMLYLMGEIRGQMERILAKIEKNV